MAAPTSPSRASAEPSVVVRKVGGRRIVSRTNPEISYAYGAPASASSRRGRTNSAQGAGTAAESGSEVGDQSPPLDTGMDSSMSPPLPPPPNAKSRYAALKERQQQQKKAPTSRKTAGTNDTNNTPLRDTATATQDRAEARSEESQSRSSMHSGGRSRAGISAVAGRFNSFYMEQPSDNLEQDVQDTTNGLPSSLLLGAQRPSQHLFASTGSNSIHSSEAGDSRSHDYAEEARQAALLARQEAAKSSTLLSNFSPSSWFKSQANGHHGKSSMNGTQEVDESIEGQVRRKKTGRTSQENLPYRPSEDEDDSESDLSGEDRKHSRRGRRADKTKRQMRDGRDDNKIWMNSGRKRRGKRRKDADGNVIEENDDGDDVQENGENETFSDGEVEDIVDTSLEGPASAVSEKRLLKRKRAQVPSSSSSTAGHLVRTFAVAGVAAVAGAYLYQYHQLRLGLPELPAGLAQRTGPQSLADASKRIVQLENAYETLRMAKIGSTREEGLLAARVDELENSLKKAKGGFSESRAAIEERMRRAESESARIHKALDDIQGRLAKALQSDASGSKIEVQGLQKRIEVLEHSTQATDKRLAETAESARRALAMTEVLQSTLAAIQRSMPREVAVPSDKRTGAPILDAATLLELRKIFVQRADLPDLSWDSFAASNEDKMRTLMSSVIGEEARTGTTIISRPLFLEMLQEELDKAKAAMETRFNANVQDIQNDILAKVRTQQNMYEKAGSWTKPTASSGQPIVTKDGSDARGAILMLIDSALEKYSADRIALRDYALYTAGGRVIPSYTSPTYRPSAQKPSLFGRLLGVSGTNGTNTVLRRHAVEGHPPVMALHHDNTPGMCWAFNGDEGQLGISLSRRVVVSDITLEHTPASVSLESGTSAPRDVTVWGIVERPEDVKRLMEFRRVLRGEAESDAGGSASLQDHAPADAPPSDRHILLGSLMYDAFADRAVQTFPVANEARSLGIPIAAVQVHVHSNHGNKDFTCLYRVRIHGREWTQHDEQKASQQDL